jgi:kynurenine formamidase
MGFIDLSHPIEDGMQAYPGLPAPKIGAILDHEQSRSHYQGKAEFYLGRVEMPCNAGTYLDSPFHRYPQGADLSQIPLASIAGLEGIVIDAPAAPGPISLYCPEADLRGRAVLIRTGWDRRWGTGSYWSPGPFLAGPAIDLLVRAGAALAGVDFWNIDDTTDPSRPAHTRLLAAGILIVEHLANLAPLPRTGFRFFAVPPPIVRGASFPVRAFAEL